MRSLSAAVGGLVILHAQDIGEKVYDMNVRYIAKLVVVVALLYVPGSTSSSYVFLL